MSDADRPALLFLLTATLLGLAAHCLPTLSYRLVRMDDQPGEER